MKHARKACCDLWGQSTILEAVVGNYFDPGGAGALQIVLEQTRDRQLHQWMGKP